MKLFGSAKGGARVAKRSKKTKADKPKKPLKVLAVVLTVILCLEGLYFLCIYSNIPFIKKYRTIYINTAMNTMRHQWLATYFIPAEIIDQVRYEYGLEIAKSVGTESQWGYADVRPNGSAYGTISNNPYAAAPSTQTGGDGFDLSWAVDADGKPVAISSARYVRVYSAVLFSAGVFGETSAEVCGLYVTSDAGSGASSKALTVARGFMSYTLSDTSITEVDAGEWTITSSAENVYINGAAVTGAAGGYTLNVVSGQLYQIITQNGTESPVVAVVKGK